jgi:transcriptional regulator with XRE-family HTH domain
MRKDRLLRETGSQIRSLRNALDVTLAQLSRACGVTAPQLSLIENGRVDARLSTLVRILDALGADLSDIVVEPPESISVEAAIARRERGRGRVEDSGMGMSNPEARLDRKDQLGEDTRVEREHIVTQRVRA